MKTVYVSGLAILLTTLLALLGVGGVFFDLISGGEFNVGHFVAISSLLLIPPLVWRRRIEIKGHMLTCQSWIYKDEFRIDQIERLNVTSHGHYYVLTIRKIHRKTPVLEFDLGLFQNHDISALLKQLQTQNAAIQIDMPIEFW